MAAQPSLMDRLFRRKPVQALVEETAGDPKHGHLERSIGLFQLTMFGVGATIGTGIFIVLTTAVPKAGPGVVLSFAIAGVTAALTALCYAELASTIPVSGSSYSYAYATLGEVVAYCVAGACCSSTASRPRRSPSAGAQYLNEILVDLFGWRHAGRDQPAARGRRRGQPAVGHPGRACAACC